MQFQDRLYRLRKERGISQEELAGVVGVSRQAVQKWEAGASRPDMDNLAALAGYFGVTLDYLIRGGTPDGQDTGTPAPDGPRPRGLPYYEYRSRRTLFGLPLVHVRLGYGMCRARGILAVGNIATGVVAVGGISAGAVCFGALSAGLLAAGGIALGGVAVGGLAVGLLALGGCAVGLLALGGAAFGQYAAGGGAWGSLMAVGDFARSACVAVGNDISQNAALGLELDQLRTAGTPLSQAAARISAQLPGTPRWIIRLLLSCAA